MADEQKQSDEGKSITSAKAEQPKMSESFLCPVCKELYVEPEMYPCGHTVCKLCVFQRHRVTCPVCKVFMNPGEKMIPVYVLRSLIEEQYPEEYKTRSKNIEELKALQEKLRTYAISTRVANIRAEMRDFLTNEFYGTWQDIMDALNKTKKFEPPVSEMEFKHFLSSHICCAVDFKTFGNFLVWGSTLKLTLLSRWMEAHKKKDQRSMLTLILAQTCGVPEQELTKMAALYKLNIGQPIKLEEWQGQPLFWLKDLANLQPSVPHHVERPEIQEDSDEEEDSEADSWDSSDSDMYPQYF